MARIDYGGLCGERIASPNNPEKGVLIHDRGFAEREIPDGLSKTIFVGECSRGPWPDGQWINGRNLFDQAYAINWPTWEDEIRSRHPGWPPAAVRRRAEVDGHGGTRGGRVDRIVERPCEINPLEEGLLLQPGEDRGGPGQTPGRPRIPARPPLQTAHGKPPPRQQVPVEGTAHVPQMVEADRPPGRLAGPLHGGQEQGHQRGDHGHHHQQLHERDAAAAASPAFHARAACRHTPPVRPRTTVRRPAPGAGASGASPSVTIATGRSRDRARPSALAVRQAHDTW
jgi:hypothetical protein